MTLPIELQNHVNLYIELADKAYDDGKRLNAIQCGIDRIEVSRKRLAAWALQDGSTANPFGFNAFDLEEAESILRGRKDKIIAEIRERIKAYETAPSYAHTLNLTAIVIGVVGFGSYAAMCGTALAYWL